MSNNLVSFLFGGSLKNRELRDTRQAWDATQQLWRASPLAQKSVSDLAIELMREASKSTDRCPATPILVAVCEALDPILRAECIGDVEPLWDLIENHVDVAIEFREVLARRRRWAGDFPRMYGAFKRILVTNIEAFFHALPERCFEEWDDTPSDAFEVVLLDLIDDPAKIIDHLFMIPYDDDSFRLDIFNSLRNLCAGNLLVASGFPRNANIREHEARLVGASRQKNKTAAELAELYLKANPFKTLLELPVPFNVSKETRFEHCHIVGGTGHGKTQLMQKMIHGDLIAAREDNRSVIVIDSQGDLIRKLSHLDLFSPSSPNSLADRLVVIDPADVEFPAALNLFDAHLDRVRQYSAADRERVLNGVIELYELFFGAFLGAELTQKQGVIFKYLARLMIAIPNATIYTLMEIMEDGKQFKEQMELLDGSARYFFESEFFHPSFAATKKQVLRRLWGVLSTPAFERMFTQPKNKLDLFEAMNDGRIILVSTAKDLLKREGSQLLGRFFIAMITQAALERSTVPEYERTPTFVYVDEAQEYFDDSIETILNQARKYRVGLTIAHQTLDQLSPRLRSALFANTSFKCAGGVSAKDARSLSEELHTTQEFIEGMKRRGPRSEFAAWVKHSTTQAIRLSVGLGFLERQPTLTEEEYDELLVENRNRYCGTLADIQPFQRKQSTSEPTHESHSTTEAVTLDSAEAKPPKVLAPSAQDESRSERSTAERTVRPRQPIEERSLGKGGSKHRYLQSVAKELAEEQGLKATIEAPITGGGQVDVLIQRDGALAAIEISVTTPVEHEQENLRKCLAASIPRVAVVLAKSKVSQANYRAALLEVVSDGDRERVAFLTPEELPDFIASLAPAPAATERVVRGYRVKGSVSNTSPEEMRAKRDALARLIAKSLARQSD